MQGPAGAAGAESKCQPAKPAGASSFSFAASSAPASTFDASFQTAPPGSASPSLDLSGDKAPVKQPLPGRRRVAVSKSKIPAVRADVPAAPSFGAGLAEQGMETTTATPFAFVSTTAAATKQPSFATGTAFSAGLIQPSGASAQPAGPFAFHGDSSSKETDALALARDAIRMAREATASVKSLQTEKGGAEEAFGDRRRKHPAVPLPDPVTSGASGATGCGGNRKLVAEMWTTHVSVIILLPSFMHSAQSSVPKTGFALLPLCTELYQATRACAYTKH